MWWCCGARVRSCSHTQGECILAVRSTRWIPLLALALVCGLTIEAMSDDRVAHATTPLVIEGQIVVRPWTDARGQIGGVEFGFRPDWRADASEESDGQGDPLFVMATSSTQIISNAGTWMHSREIPVLPSWWGNDIRGRILFRGEIDDDAQLTRIEFGLRPFWGLDPPPTETGPDDFFPTKRFLTRQIAERSEGKWLRSSRINIAVPIGCDHAIGALGCERIDVGAGANHSCAVHRSGDVTCWGENESGQARPPVGYFRFVSAGGEHTCGLRQSGHVQCWGSNEAGQISAPWGIFRAVSAGGRHTCGLHETGTVECWGANEHGQADAPAGRFIAVSAGTGHSCGIRDSREVECWGSNAVGQVDVPDGRFRSVSAGWLHSCGLLETGEIQCWGPNARGEGSPPGGKFRSVSAGAVFSCGVRDNGEVECWGWNQHGETRAPHWRRFQRVSAGGEHVCGLIEFRFSTDDRNSDIICWGANDSGQADAPVPERRNW